MAKKKHSRSRKKGHFARQPSLRQQAGRPGSQPKESEREIPARKGKKGLWLIAAAALIVIVAAAAVFLFFLKPSKTPIKRDEKLNVLLITLDTTRADRLGCYGYAKAKTPNLDALAQNGILFANAYAQVPLTLPSHCSIMTGLYPLAHNVHNNGGYALAPDKVTLAKILKDKGFKTAAFVASFSVDSRTGLDQGFDVYDDNFQEGGPFKALNSERKAEQVYAVFSPWLDKLKDEQFFCWIHFFDPHLPYNPPSPYREQFADRPYDGEVAYMDYIIGLVMREIKDRNLIGRTLVVVAGDHGEAFGEKGEAGHGVFLYDMALRVPLLFYAEGHLPAQRTIAARVRLIDVMPTVLDLLDKPAQAGVEGTSLIPFILNKNKKDLDSYIETYYPKENFGWASLTGLISGARKYIRAPKEELYDLKSDPGETRNLFSSDPKKAEDLKDGLDRLIKESLLPGSSSGKLALTAEEQARLRSLGYVDYTDKTSKTEAADPKDRIDELKMIQDAEKFEFEGNYQAAADLHEKMLALRPGAASSYVSLALAQARLKKFDEAVQTLKRGIARIPESELLLSRLGYTYLVTGRAQEAMDTMAEVLAINPRSMDALTATAMILDDAGRKAEAQGYFERALAVEPENKFLRLSYGQSLAATGRVAEAIDIYTRLTQDYPQDPMPYQLIGFTQIMLKDFDKAIENLKQAMFIKPSPPVYYFLATAYKEKGDVAETIRYLELYLEDTKGENPNRVRNAQAGLDGLKKQIR
jgi:arylsulfatase A-like enzyme/tetratricopeptide (TPR) repeat protein